MVKDGKDSCVVYFIIKFLSACDEYEIILCD